MPEMPLFLDLPYLSFVCLRLWNSRVSCDLFHILVLLVMVIALLYNYIYEQIQTQDTSDGSERSDSPADIQAGGDEVSNM